MGLIACVLLLLVRMMMIGSKSALSYLSLYCVVFIKFNRKNHEFTPPLFVSFYVY